MNLVLVLPIKIIIGVTDLTNHVGIDRIVTTGQIGGIIMVLIIGGMGTKVILDLGLLMTVPIIITRIMMRGALPE